MQSTIQCSLQSSEKLYIEMRSNDTFNIITGQVKRQYPMNNHSRRFASLDVVRKMQETMKQPQEKILPSTNNRPLGTAKDHQLYQYSYLPRNFTAGNTHSFSCKYKMDAEAAQSKRLPRNRLIQTFSLVNASKTGFNIISHGTDFLGQANWQSTKKRCPVSKFTELGHAYASNFRDDFKQTNKFNKKSSICTYTCELQKSYGTEKMFRKYK